MNTKIKVNVLEKFTSPNLSLRNRVVMAPMTRSRAAGNVPNEIMAQYYRQRASAGLIITEGTSPSPNGLGYARIPGIYSQDQIGGWKKITNAVHSEGGKIFVQLMHTGRISHNMNMPEGSKILAPSAIRPAGEMWTDQAGMKPYPVPNEMTLEDIRSSIEEFAQAAENAIESGFDGIELHGANGYLLEQFLNPEVNTRNDQYGGSVQNRIRFALEVVNSVIEKIGEEKVGIRLSPYNTFNDMPLFDDVFHTYQGLAEQLNKIGIAYIHLVEGPAANQDNGISLLKTIREKFSNILIVNGGYDVDRAEEVVSSEYADLVAFGRPFISNPDFVKRIKNEWPLASGDPATFYSPGEKGYIDYPVYSEN